METVLCGQLRNKSSTLIKDLPIHRFDARPVARLKKPRWEADNGVDLAADRAATQTDQDRCTMQLVPIVAKLARFRSSQNWTKTGNRFDRFTATIVSNRNARKSTLASEKLTFITIEGVSVGFLVLLYIPPSLKVIENL